MRGVELGPLGQRTQHVRREIDRMDAGQAAATTSDWCAYRTDDHRITHRFDGTPACNSETMSDDPRQFAPSDPPQPRSPAPSRPAQPRRPAPAPGSAQPAPSGEAPEVEPEHAAQPWRVRPVIGIAKIAGGVAVIGLAVLAGGNDPVRWFLAVACAIALLGWGARDLIAPVRLAADHEGVTVVVGYAGRRRLAWVDIERVRMDRRERLGLRSNLLEVDAGDALYLFSANELGADPEAVLRTLLELRSEPSSDTPPER